MSQATNGVHRCPSCDELADANYGEDGSVTCSKCGHSAQRTVPPVRSPRTRGLRVGDGSLVQRDVSARRAGLDELPQAKAHLPQRKVDAPTSDIYDDRSSQAREEVVEEDQDKKTVRRRKRKRGVKLSRIIFITLWFVCIFVTLFVLRKQMRDSRTVLPKEEIAKKENDEIEKKRRAEATGYVKQAMPECAEILKKFLNAPDAATRAQYVRKGEELAPQMATFYGQNTALKIKEQWYLRDENLVLFDKLRAIESEIMTGKGEAREVVFIREERAWKVDWEFFVKHSSSPWHLFLSELGPSEGTFRVYARLRESTSRGDSEKVIKLRFYPAISDSLVRNRSSSPVVLVPEETESGRRILQVIEERSEKPLTGERTFQQGDPDDLYRVRVALEWREGADGERYLHLNKVLAGNWLGHGFEEFSDSSE